MSDFRTQLVERMKQHSEKEDYKQSSPSSYDTIELTKKNCLAAADGGSNRYYLARESVTVCAGVARYFNSLPGMGAKLVSTPDGTYVEISW